MKYTLILTPCLPCTCHRCMLVAVFLGLDFLSPLLLFSENWLIIWVHLWSLTEFTVPHTSIYSMYIWLWILSSAETCQNAFFFCQVQYVVLTFSPRSLCLPSFEIKGQKVIKISLSGGLPGQSTLWFSKHIVWVQLSTVKESSKENADLDQDSSQALISIFQQKICIRSSSQSHLENTCSELTNYTFKF